MQELQASHGELDATMWTETITTFLLKKLLVMFPLYPANQFSEKV